ncbi:MAG: hypothetical protein IPJ05_08925 [Nitrosomonas sp.]|nr:hypothetical protein [Nitrosomonas sp.]
MSFIGVLLNAFLSYVYLAYYPTVLQIAFEPDATVIVAEMLLFVLLLMLARRSSIRNPFSAGYLLHPRITGSLIGCFGLLACYVAVNIMMKQPLPGSPWAVARHHRRSNRPLDNCRRHCCHWIAVFAVWIAAATRHLSFQKLITEEIERYCRLKRWLKLQNPALRVL